MAPAWRRPDRLLQASVFLFEMFGGLTVTVLAAALVLWGFLRARGAEPAV